MNDKNLIKLDYNCAEINGTGFGAILCL